MNNVYQQLAELETDAIYWETRARTFLNLLTEARNLLAATKDQGTLPITELELSGLIGTIDEEISSYRN